MPSGWNSKQHHRLVSERLDEITQELANLIAKKKPKTQKQILDLMADIDYQKKVTDLTINSATYGAVTTIGSDLIFDEFDESAFLYPKVANKVKKSWTQDDITLSSRVYRSTLQQSRAIKKQLQTTIRETGSIIDDMRGILDDIELNNRITRDQLAKGIKRFISTAESVGKKTSNPNILKLANSQKKQILSYSDRIKTPYLKRSYTNLVKSFEKGSQAEFDKAIANVVKQKAKYMSERIARTETMRSEYEAFYVNREEDNFFNGVYFYLSSSHVVPDVCDIHTGIDLGYGKGIYPLYSAPSYPFHPNCFCNYDSVQVAKLKRSEKPTKQNVRESGESYLANIPTSKRKKILGIQKNRQFEQGEDWTRLQNNYNGLSDPRKSVRFVLDDFERK